VAKLLLNVLLQRFLDLLGSDAIEIGRVGDVVYDRLQSSTK
jgi:hypothetical protein